MGSNTLRSPISAHSEVAGPGTIAAPGASYAVDFSQRLKNAELLPSATADCSAAKIDEHREDESQRLRRQPVHGNGAAPKNTHTLQLRRVAALYVVQLWHGQTYDVEKLVREPEFTDAQAAFDAAKAWLMNDAI